MIQLFISFAAAIMGARGDAIFFRNQGCKKRILKKHSSTINNTNAGCKQVKTRFFSPTRFFFPDFLNELRHE
jgi:hypothetical protein